MLWLVDLENACMSEVILTQKYHMVGFFFFTFSQVKILFSTFLNSYEQSMTLIYLMVECLNGLYLKLLTRHNLVRLQVFNKGKVHDIHTDIHGHR